jgi:hypothetical protein
MIFQVDSEIFTHKPGANNDSDVEVEVEDENEKTPRQKKDGIKQGKPDTSEEPYETPAILRTKRWAPSVAQVDDTEADDSEIEREVIKAIMKRRKATVSSS